MRNEKKESFKSFEELECWEGGEMERWRGSEMGR